MSVVVDSEEAGGLAHSSTISPLVYSFNNVAGNFLLLAVNSNEGAGGGNIIIGTPTYNGVAMSPVPSTLLRYFTDGVVQQLFYLINPATGSKSFSIPVSGGAGPDIIAAAISFSGVDLTNPFGALATASDSTGSTTNATVNVPGTATGNFVISFVSTGTSLTSATAPTVMSAKKNVSAGTAGDCFGLGRQPGGGGTVTVAYAVAGPENFGLVAVEINALVSKINTTLEFKRSNTAAAVPALLSQGELAINMIDKILYSGAPSVGSVANRSDTTNITYASRTNTVITAPATIVDGDLLLIYFIEGGTTSPTPTPPAGFTIVSGFPQTVGPDVSSFMVKHYCWVKTASSESGSYTITHTTTTTQAFMASYSNVDATTPITPASTFNKLAAGSTTTTALGLTTPRDGSMVIFISQDWGDTNNTLVAPTGTTPTFTKEMWVSGGILLVADGVLATAGATGNKTATNNNTGGNSLGAGIMICIQPAISAVFQIPMIAGGANTDVQFNDSSRIGGTFALTFDKTTNNLICSNALTISSNVFNLGTPSVTANGFNPAPSNVFMQWGWRSTNSTSGFVAFPTTFPTGVFVVVASSNTGASGNKTFVPAVTQQNTSGCTIVSANATAANVFWMAVGN
jgi:hypothetical protein